MSLRCLSQARDERTLAMACASPRSCAKAYPLIVRIGMVWVWPDGSDNRFHEAQLATPWIPAEFERAVNHPTVALNRGTKNCLYVRDAPFDYGGMFENLMDPAHFQVAHHGIGNLNRCCILWGSGHLSQLSVSLLSGPEC